MGFATVNQSFSEDEIIQKENDETERDIHVFNIVSYEINKALDLRGQLNATKVEEPKVGQFDIPGIKRVVFSDTKNYFTKVQSWVGHVTEINKDSFKGRIEEANNHTGSYEDVEFEVDEVDEEDKKILTVGAIFYWSIGFEYRKGTKIKESILRFKRLPRWTTSDIDNAKDLADDLYDNLNWEE